jgi:branched-chain amino acid transport system permease protein
MATATGIFHTSYRRDFALRHTRAEWVRLALIGAVAVVAPFQADAFWLEALCQMVFLGIAVVGLMILTGYTGLVSLATGGFLGVGAYTTGVLVTRVDLPPPVGIAAAVVVAFVLGAFFGLPALRLKGLYLAIASFAAQYIFTYAFQNWRALYPKGEGSIVLDAPRIGGFNFRRPELFGRDTLFGRELTGDFLWYWIGLAFLALSVTVAVNLFRTGLGRGLIAIRDQDIAAEVVGVPVGRYKVLAFAVASAFAGLAGALNAHRTGAVTPEAYEISTSFLAVAMIIIGGLGNVAGAVYGAGFMVWLQSIISRFGQELRETNEFISKNVVPLQVAAFGLVIVLFLLFEPRGLARLWQRTKDYFRLWPFRY